MGRAATVARASSKDVATELKAYDRQCLRIEDVGRPQTQHGEMLLSLPPHFLNPEMDERVMGIGCFWQPWLALLPRCEERFGARNFEPTSGNAGRPGRAWTSFDHSLAAKESRC